MVECPHSGRLLSNAPAGRERHVFERFKHLKAALAAGIEMGSLLICEVDVFSDESVDAQEMNVTSGRRKIGAITFRAIFLRFVHYLPPVSYSAVLSNAKASPNGVFSVARLPNQRFGFEEALEGRLSQQEGFENLWKISAKLRCPRLGTCAAAGVPLSWQGQQCARLCTTKPSP
jgi:hypothetical protein